MKTIIRIFFLFPFLVQGQTPTPVQDFGTHPRAFTSRHSFWSEISLACPLSKNERWQFQVDLKYRRAADADFIKGGQHANIFKDTQQHIIWPWIHYWAIPGSVRFSFSPIGYWLSWTPEAEAATYHNRDSVLSGQGVFPEFRITPQVTTFQNFGRVQFSQRFRFEYRFIGERRAADNNLSDYTKGYHFLSLPVGDQNEGHGWFGSNQAGRFRWQARVQVPINHPRMENRTFYFSLSNELFLSFGRHVKSDRLLNQNRFVFLAGYRFHKKSPIRLECGLTLQTNFLFNMDLNPSDPSETFMRSNVENNHAWTIMISFENFRSLFKKEKPE